eukprot:6097386-Amphidinium_carterae.1
MSNLWMHASTTQPQATLTVPSSPAPGIAQSAAAPCHNATHSGEMAFGPQHHASPLPCHLCAHSPAVRAAGTLIPCARARASSPFCPTCESAAALYRHEYWYIHAFHFASQSDSVLHLPTFEGLAVFVVLKFKRWDIEVTA